MATKDTLPTNEAIWAGEWIPSRVNRDFIKPAKAPRKSRKAKRKPKGKRK